VSKEFHEAKPYVISSILLPLHLFSYKEFHQHPLLVHPLTYILPLISVKKYLNLYTFRPKLGNMLCGTEH